MSDTPPVMVVRKTTSVDRRVEAHCSCGRKFQFVAQTETGKRLYFWCRGCDRPGKSK